MKKKILIQLFLFSLFLFLSIFFFYEYFIKESQIIKKTMPDKNLLTKNLATNLISDLRYFSIDDKGNKYEITAKFGEMGTDNSDIILMTDVKAIIKIYNSEHDLKDEIIDIAKEAGYEPDRMTFKQWVYGESPLGFEGKELTEEEEAEVWAKKDDYCVEGVEVYRPIYDYTCNDPTIIAPDWW